MTTTTTSRKAPAAKKAPAKPVAKATPGLPVAKATPGLPVAKATPGLPVPTNLAPVGVKSKVTSATKFRVATRAAGLANGWRLVQIDTGVDQYTRDGVTVHIHHGPSDLVTKAEKLDGETLEVIEPASKLKVERAYNWLVPAEAATEFLRVSKDLVATYESGKDLAQILIFAPQEAPGEK